MTHYLPLLVTLATIGAFWLMAEVMGRAHGRP